MYNTKKHKTATKTVLLADAVFQIAPGGCRIMVVLANFSAFYGAFSELKEHEFEAELDDLTPQKRSTQSYQDDQSGGQAKHLNGADRFYCCMMDIMDGFKNKPHIFQEEFVKHLMKAAAPKIVGVEWEIYGPSIQRAFGYKDNCKQVLCAAARRMGKTEICAIFQAAVAHWVCCTMAAFATVLRIAKEMNKKVQNLLMNSDKASWIKPRSIKQDEITIITFDGRESVLNYYPGSPLVRGCFGCLALYGVVFPHSNPSLPLRTLAPSTNRTQDRCAVRPAAVFVLRFICTQASCRADTASPTLNRQNHRSPYLPTRYSKRRSPAHPHCPWSY
jgi:hypothetical protein